MNLTDKFEHEKLNEWCDYIVKYSQVCNYERGILPDNTPENTKLRYDLMKDYTANWYFLNYKYDFLRQSAGRHDIDLIEAHLHHLDKLRKHEKLTSPNSRKELYLSAIKYINELNDYGILPNKYGKEEKELYLIILLEKNYFDGEELPDEVYDLCDAYNDIVAIPDIYGEYFLFYNYLTNKLNELPQPAKQEIKLSDKNEHAVTPKDLFRPMHLDKYKQIIELLAKDLPPTLAKKHKRKSPFIDIDGDTITWLTNYKGAKNTLACMVATCKKKGWLHNNLGPTDFQKILNALFHAGLNSRTAFTNMADENMDGNTLELFDKLFTSIS